MIIVTGPGRSGTTVVARILHQRLGVHMGDRCPPPQPGSPDGCMEDLDFRELHVAVLAGELSLPEFRQRARALIGEREEAHGDAWGFKDPRAAHLLGLYLQWKPALWIFCWRDRGSVVASIGRHYGTPPEEARRETHERMLQLSNLMSWCPAQPAAFGMVTTRALWLDMGERRDEEELEGLIGGWLSIGGLRPRRSPGSPLPWRASDRGSFPAAPRRVTRERDAG